MKGNILSIIVFTLLISCNANGQRANTSKQNILKKEFKYHFHIFDSTIARYPLDSIYPGQPYSIKFMEENTRINSESDMTLLGKIFFSKKDLQKWHEWYDKKYGKKNN